VKGLTSPPHVIYMLDTATDIICLILSEYHEMLDITVLLTKALDRAPYNHTYVCVSGTVPLLSYLIPFPYGDMFDTVPQRTVIRDMSDTVLLL
jgi:hypothetical protein